jgi:hypothetical protein
MTNKPRQPDGSSINQGNPPSATVNTHNGTGLYYPQVTPQCEFQSARHGMTGDSRYDRFGQLQATRSHRAVACLRQGVGTFTGCNRFQIGSRTESPMIAVKNSHITVIVILKVIKGSREGERGLTIDGIANLRSRQGNYCDPAFYLYIYGQRATPE